MKVYQHVSHLFSMQPLTQGHIKNATSLEDCGYVADGCVWVDDQGLIAWIGATPDMPAKPEDAEVVDCHGETWLPGLIDCHTHLCFGGHRAHEAMLKRSGLSYLAIAKEGGGIQSTVLATRKCSKSELFDLTCARVEKAMIQGITHVEIKSGYGLAFDSELLMLDVIQDVKQSFEGRVGVTSTFLGAHAFPKDMDPERYLKILLEEMLPCVAETGNADFCDVFIEKGFFDLAQGRRVLECAQKLGLGLKAHVDECFSLGGVELAVGLGATSIEHGIQITDDAISALAGSSTTCVLLPLTSLFLQEGYAPGRKLIDKGVRVAMATDFNPGSSPSQNLMMAAQMGMIHYGLNPFEALCAVTFNAACALAREEDLGHLSVGQRPMVSRFAYRDWEELLYWIGQPYPVLPDLRGGKGGAL